MKGKTFAAEEAPPTGHWVEWPVAVERLWKVTWGRPVEEVEMQLRTSIAHGWIRAVEVTLDGAPPKRIDKADFWEYDAAFEGEVEQCTSRRSKLPDWYDSCVQVCGDELSNLLVSGNEARAVVERASGYPADAAADWVLRNIVERRVWAWYGSQLICHSRLDTGSRLKCFMESVPSLPLAALLIVKKTLVQALAVEFPLAKDRPTSTSVAAAPGEYQRYDPESQCEEWLKSKMLKSPDRPPKPKAALLNEAQRLFPGLTGRAFRDRAWPSAIRETGAKWDNPGRKSSR